MKKALTLVVIFAALLGLVSWGKYRGSHQTIKVTTATVTEGVLEESILASGNLIYKSQVQIRSEVTGRVDKVLVKEGDVVTQGQILLKLDPISFEADVGNAQAAVNAQSIEIKRLREVATDLKRQFQQQQELFATQAIDENALARINSQYKIAVINVEAAMERLKQRHASLTLAENRLSKTLFRAQMDGLISTVDVKEGETVIAGTTNIVGSPLMTLADPSDILAELRVDEADIANIKMAQRAKVFVAASPKTALTGKVIQIGTSARSSGHQGGLIFRVKVLLDSVDQSLFPGMSCRAELITASTKKSFNIPIAALKKDKKKHYVWVVKTGKVFQQAVTPGLATDTEQAILAGLILDQTIVTGPARNLLQLKEGTPIEVKHL